MQTIRATFRLVSLLRYEKAHISEVVLRYLNETFGIYRTVCDQYVLEVGYILSPKSGVMGKNSGFLS